MSRRPVVCLIIPLLAVAPLAAQRAPLAPHASMLFQAAPAAATDSAPGFRPNSWPRAAAGAAIGAVAAAIILRMVYSDHTSATDGVQVSRDRPYVLVMVPAAIVGFIIGGSIGSPD